MKTKIISSFLALGLLIGGCGDSGYNDLEKESNADGSEKVDTSTLSDLFNKQQQKMLSLRCKLHGNLLKLKILTLI